MIRDSFSAVRTHLANTVDESMGDGPVIVILPSRIPDRHTLQYVSNEDKRCLVQVVRMWWADFFPKDCIDCEAYFGGMPPTHTSRLLHAASSVDIAFLGASVVWPVLGVLCYTTDSCYGGIAFSDPMDSILHGSRRRPAIKRSFAESLPSNVCGERPGNDHGWCRSRSLNLGSMPIHG